LKLVIVRSGITIPEVEVRHVEAVRGAARGGRARGQGPGAAGDSLGSFARASTRHYPAIVSGPFAASGSSAGSGLPASVGRRDASADLAFVPLTASGCHRGMADVSATQRDVLAIR